MYDYYVYILRFNTVNSNKLFNAGENPDVDVRLMHSLYTSD